MSRLPLSAEAFDRRFGITEATLVNFYTEPSPEGPTQRRAVQRPGLVAGSTVGNGPIRAYVKVGADVYVVSGRKVFKNGSQVGVMPGAGLVRYASYDADLVMVAEGKAYLVGAAVTLINMPDGDAVSDVIEAGGRFLYSIADTGKYRYSGIADPTTIGDLNFASAESDPDNIVAMCRYGEDVLLFGENTVEWHSPTTSIDAPFIRNGGRRYTKGCTAPGTIVEADNSVYWLGGAGDDLQVYRADAVPVAVSNEGISAALALCADPSQCWAVKIDNAGHEFYVISIPGVSTYALDLRTRLWSEFKSYGKDNFRLWCGESVYGDRYTNQLWTLDPDRRTDDSDPISYVIGAYLSLDEGVLPLRNLRLHVKAGVGGPGETPLVEVRYKDQLWSEWSAFNLGGAGHATRIIKRQLGMVKPPGRAFQFRADSVDFTPYGLSYNFDR